MRQDATVGKSLHWLADALMPLICQHHAELSGHILDDLTAMKFTRCRLSRRQKWAIHRERRRWW